MKKAENAKYFLGLDVGTDSVGYAVTDEQYHLLKFKGEPMWGATLFDAASTSADRRTFRSARRRLDRRQQRVQLLSELFAGEIAKIDPNFFIRRKESALFPEDSQFGPNIFAGDGITGEEYHNKYPTIHHLLLDLMKSAEPHDIRLIYIACAWLVAHRGHFLLDIPSDNVNDVKNFGKVYQNFLDYIHENDYVLPWSEDIPSQTILSIMQESAGITKKAERFRAELFDSSKKLKGEKEYCAGFPLALEPFISLLAGGKVSPAALFDNEAYAEVEKISLSMEPDEYERIVSSLDTDADIIHKLRAMYECAQLVSVLDGVEDISEAKVKVYNQHQKDLKYLKLFVKKYCPEKYNEIFRDVVKVDNQGRGNYVSFSRNTKAIKREEYPDVKFATKVGFSEFLLNRVKGISVSEEDAPAYEDMLRRLELYTFLPKQIDGDNRLIPQQLYRAELEEILGHASQYTPLLSEVDADGLSIKDKIVAIFDFKIPYFVGPLNPNAMVGKNEKAWIERKAGALGPILPWNFAEKIDFDKSEAAFIRRMTNQCTYLPMESVLPDNSLLYERFKALNILNGLKVNGVGIPVEVKQELYTELLEKRASVGMKQIKDYLMQHCYMGRDDELSGIDATVKFNLKAYHTFKNMLDKGILSFNDAEETIEHMAFTEDKPRFRKWLKSRFPDLCDADINYIVQHRLKEFGRLSQRFLSGIYGTQKDSDGEAHTIIEMLWETNENLMQLLSDRYTFAETVHELCEAYYTENPASLDKRLSEMYVSNAVKRPIFRTFDIVKDVVKAMGCAPSKIFVEMARGGTPEQKGKRTQSRKEQLLAWYKNCKGTLANEAKQFEEQLKEMGALADNKLQDKKLFLYYLQMGKCAYSGEAIELSKLASADYNIDHIYPQAFVKDDSLLNNLVLVKSDLNGRKKDIYPVNEDIRHKMQSVWFGWMESGLLTKEKYNRLVRSTPFTDDEKMGFINRQLVETRQSSKVIATLLQEHFPDAEIVYVKAGMVSEFRQEFKMIKCRSVNDMHHAKDAYLNIVVGNVYHERFTKKWFCLSDEYNVQVKRIFVKPHSHKDVCYWRGEDDLALVRKTMGKNAAHLTRFAYCKKHGQSGGLFDQQPQKAKDGLIPLKAGLSTEKYGGYNKATASFFILAQFCNKKKTEIMFVPIPAMNMASFSENPDDCVKEQISSILGIIPNDLKLLLNGHPLKIGASISLDGLCVTLSGKGSGGKVVLLSPITPLILSYEDESYIKAIENVLNKRKTNKNYLPDADHDGISKEKNLHMYDKVAEKLSSWPFNKLPCNPYEQIAKCEARSKFKAADPVEQITLLMGMIQLIAGKAKKCDLKLIGGAPGAGGIALNSKLSNWCGKYDDVRIIDSSASGLFSTQGKNLLSFL